MYSRLNCIEIPSVKTLSRIKIEMSEKKRGKRRKEVSNSGENNLVPCGNEVQLNKCKRRVLEDFLFCVAFRSGMMP